MSSHHFPLYHVRPPTGLINDPNGPVVIDGVTHLYFQYQFATRGSSAVSWGHVSSSDLVNWSYHRLAMTPDPDGLDRNGCFSGNTVSHDGRLVAFYSGFLRNRPYQSVLFADSLDGGMSFMPSRLALADPPPSAGIAHFRDPFVWQSAPGEWRLIIGAGRVDGRASVAEYSSNDLETWSYEGVVAHMPPRIAADGIETGHMWECPQMVLFDEGDVLIVAPLDVIALRRLPVMTIDLSADSPRTPRRYDHGPEFYAPSVLRQDELTQILWGWSEEGRDYEWAVEDDWFGVLTLPRVVRKGLSGELLSSPVAELATLRNTELRAEATPGATSTVSGLSPQAELLVTVPADVPGATSTVLLRFSDVEHLDIEIDRSSGRVRIDRRHASRDARAFVTGVDFSDPGLSAGDDFEMRVFIDGSIMEVFTGSGRCATLRFYPLTPPPWTVVARGAIVRVWNLVSHGSSDSWPDT